MMGTIARLEKCIDKMIENVEFVGGLLRDSPISFEEWEQLKEVYADLDVARELIGKKVEG